MYETTEQKISWMTKIAMVRDKFLFWLRFPQLVAQPAELTRNTRRNPKHRKSTPVLVIYLFVVEFQNLQFSPNITDQVKVAEMGKICSKYGEQRNSDKARGKTLLGRLRRRWEAHIHPLQPSNHYIIPPSSTY
jgi:hypothetical protein